MESDLLDCVVIQARLDVRQRAIEATTRLEICTRQRGSSAMEPRLEVHVSISPQALFTISHAKEVGLEALVRRMATQEAERGSTHMRLRRNQESVEDRTVDALHTGSETALCSTDDAWGWIVQQRDQK